MDKSKVPTYSFWGLLLLMFIAAISIYLALHARSSAYSGSILVFRRFSDLGQGVFEVLALADGNADQQISLGYYRGVPAISRDGNYLAAGCPNDFNKLCIVNIQTIKNKTPSLASALDLPVVKTVELPGPCMEMLSLQGNADLGWPSTGVDSISWSFDDSKLAVVCKKNSMGRKAKLVFCLLMNPKDQLVGNFQCLIR